MARPIAETPILTGADAVRFEKLRIEVEELSKEKRAENTRKLKEAVQKAKEYITICIQKMKLVRLTPDTVLAGFDCGDEDLNNFLVEDAKGFLDKRIATSYILEDDGNIVAYFCLLNDKISRQDVTNSQWKRIKGGFPERKQFGSYPAIKIGRFAVSSRYRGRNIGTDLMNLLKGMLAERVGYSAFRYLTVDAYLSAIDFYQKNGFKVLSEKILNDHTRLMFFDMMELE